MRIAIAFLLLATIALGGCGVGMLGDLGQLSELACSVYDLNEDGTTTSDEVVAGYEAITGTTPSDAEVQDFLTTYCS